MSSGTSVVFFSFCVCVCVPFFVFFLPFPVLPGETRRSELGRCSGSFACRYMFGKLAWHIKKGRAGNLNEKRVRKLRIAIHFLFKLPRFCSYFFVLFACGGLHCSQCCEHLPTVCCVISDFRVSNYASAVRSQSQMSVGSRRRQLIGVEGCARALF